MLHRGDRRRLFRYEGNGFRSGWGIMDAWYTRLDSKSKYQSLVQEPLGAMASTHSFRASLIRGTVRRFRRMVPSSSTRTRVPGQRALARSSPI